MKKILKYLDLLMSPELFGQLRTAVADFLNGNVAQLRRLHRFGRRSVVYPSARLAYAEHIEIGENVRVGRWVCLWAGPNSRIIVGDDTSISVGSFVTSDNCGLRRGIPHRHQPGREADVIIGNDVWIGANSVLLPGTVIHDGAVIGAGSVVTGEIPANAVAVGNPARVIRYREP